ncbi:MAG: toxin-antitoxin system YwqK family antitoxin [Flavobacteriales bacterium]
MYARTLLLAAGLILFTKALAQTTEKCPEPDLVFEGILADNSNTRPVIRDLEGDLPKAGDRGDLYKKFEEKLFGGIMTGWISIGYVEVVSTSAGRCTLKVLEKKASVTVDGKDKNLFVAGRTVKFEKYSPATPQPYTELYENGQVKIKGSTLCGVLVGQVDYFYENGNPRASLTLNENEEKNGPFKNYYPNGQLKESGNYKNGKRDGDFTGWYENGTKDVETHFTNDVRTGSYVEYEENGDISFRGNYNEKGKQSGLWQYYEKGKLVREGTLLNDKEDGTWKYYYENGSLKQQGSYSAAERNGEWTEYYPDGGKKLLVTYRNGRRVGLQQKFYTNGQYEESLTLNSNGKPEGLYSLYYENGQLQVQATMDSMGRYTGEYTAYYPDGKLKTKGNYENGRKTGTWFSYDEKGKKKKEKF